MNSLAVGGSGAAEVLLLVFELALVVAAVSLVIWLIRRARR
jgi:hypothetical protein